MAGPSWSQLGLALSNIGAAPGVFQQDTIPAAPPATGTLPRKPNSVCSAIYGYEKERKGERRRGQSANAFSSLRRSWSWSRYLTSPWASQDLFPLHFYLFSAVLWFSFISLQIAIGVFYIFLKFLWCWVCKDTYWLNYELCCDKNSFPAYFKQNIGWMALSQPQMLNLPLNSGRKSKIQLLGHCNRFEEVEGKPSYLLQPMGWNAFPAFERKSICPSQQQLSGGGSQRGFTKGESC